MKMPSLPSWWKLVGGASVIIGVVVGINLIVDHYQDLVDSKVDLTAQVAERDRSLREYNSLVERQNNAIEEWQQANDRLLQIMERLNRVSLEAEEQTRRLNETLSEHDLEALARAKPGLVERAINRGSNDAWRMLECASGATSSCPAGSGEADVSAARPEPETPGSR